MVFVFTYVRLVWGLIDVLYEGIRGELDRFSERLVMLVDLEIKIKSEKIVINFLLVNRIIVRIYF